MWHKSIKQLGQKLPKRESFKDCHIPFLWAGTMDVINPSQHLVVLHHVWPQNPSSHSPWVVDWSWHEGWNLSATLGIGYFDPEWVWSNVHSLHWCHRPQSGLLDAHQTQIRSHFLICQSIKQHLYAQVITSQDLWDFRCVRELGTRKGKRPLAVFCKSKLLSLETHKWDGRRRKVKLTTNNFNLSSVSTDASETSLGGCGEVKSPPA